MPTLAKKRSARRVSSTRGGPVAPKPYLLLSPDELDGYVKHRSRWFARKEAQRLTLKHDAVFTVYAIIVCYTRMVQDELHGESSAQYIVINEDRNAHEWFGAEQDAMLAVVTTIGTEPVYLLRAAAKYKPARCYGTA